MDKVKKIAGRIGENPYLKSISQSMMAMIAITLVGSIAVIALVIPVEFLQEFFANVGLVPVFATVNTVTIGAISVYVSFLVARNLVNNKMKDDDGLMAGVTSLLSFLILTPLSETADGISAIPTTWLGAQGLFSAMITGLLVGQLYIWMKQKGWIVKMPESVPPMVIKVFESLIPTVVISIIFIVVSVAFSATPFGSIHDAIFTIIQEPLTGVGGSIWAFIFLSLLQQVLWFFGLHGTNIVLPMVQALWLSMDLANLEAYAAGTPLPNVLGQSFFMIATWGGTALGLVILMLFSKSKQYRQVGKVSIVPALFGITEPVIFGTPLMLNFKLAVPFITNNSIAMIIGYLLIQSGIMPRMMGTQTIFGLPFGFFAAVGGHWSHIVFQIFIQLILSPILWYPWFKMAEKDAVMLEQEG